MGRTFIFVVAVVGGLHTANYPSKGHAQAAAAEDPAAPDPELTAESRRLKNHVFLFPVLQDSAFVTTHVGIREGFAMYEVPNLPVGVFGTRDITLSGIQQTFDLGLRITDWLGAFAFGRAIFVAGVDQQSLIVDGVSVDFVGEIGVVGRLFKSEKTGTQVSVRARVSRRSGQDVTIQPLVVRLLEGVAASLEDVSDGDVGRLVLVPTDDTTVNVGAHAAQYINRYLTAQASLVFERGWETREPYIIEFDARSEDDADVVTGQLAAAIELDFTQLFAPISLLGEYMHTIGERTEEGRPDTDLGASNVGLGIYYVGRPNLQLGISGVTTLSAEPRRGIGLRGEQELSDDPTLTYVDLILRYVW